jgi:hypothetical protein
MALIRRFFTSGVPIVRNLGLRAGLRRRFLAPASPDTSNTYAATYTATY